MKEKSIAEWGRRKRGRKKKNLKDETQFAGCQERIKKRKPGIKYIYIYIKIDDDGSDEKLPEKFNIGGAVSKEKDGTVSLLLGGKVNPSAEDGLRGTSTRVVHKQTRC